jgi:hypothetical protein
MPYFSNNHLLLQIKELGIVQKNPNQIEGQNRDILEWRSLSDPEVQPKHQNDMPGPEVQLEDHLNGLEEC